VPLIGKTISHYRILEKLGEGGMGVVYKARDTRLDRFVALKFLPPHLGQTGEEKTRFIHEAKTASALDHPNICTIYEIDETQPTAGEPGSGQMFIAMACYEGESLQERIGSGSLAIDEAVDFAIQISQGLAKAHSKDIIHRDIKPANILITEDGQVKLVDFGLAKFAGRTMITKEGTTLGTISYMSPEQTKGTNVDQRTDIFSLGVVLYEMLAGQRPFRADYDQAVMYWIMNQDPEPISEVRSAVPLQLERIVNKCLAKDPEERYLNADELIDDLRHPEKQTSAAIPSGAEVDRAVHVKGTSTTPAVTPTLKRSLIGLASLAFIALAVFAVWKLRSTQSPALVENRVAVAYFKNETGDSSLDYLRRMAADHLIQGIEQVDFVEITALVPEDEIDSTKRRSEQLKSLSDKTGASIIVAGVYYSDGKTLIFQPEVNNMTTGKPLKAVQRISGALSEPSVILDDVVQRVLSLLAFKFDLDWKTYSDYMGDVPTYDAYKEFKEGWELNIGQGKYLESIERFNRAVELDSTFYHAYFMIAGAYLDSGSFAEADSVVGILNDNRDALTLNERKLATFMGTWVNGDLLGNLRAAREIVEFDPDWSYNVGWAAERLNRLDEAEAWYSKIDPDDSWVKTWEGYWSQYGDVLHVQGKSEDALRIVEDRRKRFPESRYALVAEVVAHIALGDLKRAVDLKRDIYTSMDGIDPGQGLTRVAMEFATHGFRKEARQSIEESINWFNERPVSELDENRVEMFDALFVAEFSLDEELEQDVEPPSKRVDRIELMREIAGELVSEDPSNENYLGRLGILHAELGNLEDASRISESLGNLDKRFTYGQNIFWQAAIATRLGEHSRAVTMLYDAQSNGDAFGIWFHRDPMWSQLRENSGFKEFVRPKR